MELTLLFFLNLLKMQLTLLKVFNPQYAFVIPSGGSADEKIVKVALEGQSVVKDVENADDSMEFKAYKKVGTAVLKRESFWCVSEYCSIINNLT
jgi:hypothetical protein